jgi:hypothetical protein
MSFPIFDRLSDASTRLVQAKERSIDEFAQKAGQLALVVEEVFRRQIERREELSHIRLTQASAQQDLLVAEHVPDLEATPLENDRFINREQAIRISPLDEQDPSLWESHQLRQVTAVEEASEPTMIQRVIHFVLGFFQGSPNEEPDMDPMLAQLAAPVIRESRAVIIGKLIEYSQKGEDRTVPFDQDKKEQVLEYLKRNIHGASFDIFSMTMNRLIDKLNEKTETNNTLDWNKVLDIVKSLDRISEAGKQA